MEQHSSAVADHATADRPCNPQPYTFIRENGRWHIDFPGYLERGGHLEDLLMEAGADDLLDFLARNKRKVTLMLDTEPFDGSDSLELTELCDAPMGGAYYLLPVYRERAVNRKMWLRDLTLFLFGDMPQRLYIRRIKPPVTSPPFTATNR
ncbi:DUF6717 family protein [Paraflavisolibacter sp. H34]|uniref:DUF6717 family protein n=1 Tax=Huijunlia imazamoxiresistens TaxID=3127457 RepID=UPI0030189739